MGIALRVARATVIGLAAAILMFAPGAEAGDTVLRGPAPSWVAPLPETAGTPVPDEAGGGVRLLLFDAQYRAEDGRQLQYLRIRSMATSPQGLAALGVVGLAWSPASQDVTVHHLTLVRDREEIDLLASQEFEAFRREENLEMATLDGRLTAVLQPSGLRVGDVIDLAYTITSRDPVIADQPEQSMDLNFATPVQYARMRASWPNDVPVTTRASGDWTPLPVRRAGGYSSIEVVRQNTQPVLVPDDAPGRLRAVNRIELSSYRNWAEVGAAMTPLYDNARQLDPESPLHAEIERIRALSDDPAIQAAAALRLVQDQVRYVALLMGEGGLTPATADETWSRRFGDCKGKTTLLLALLDGLDIPAEPAAVSLLAGDGLDQGLPMIAAFDHVIVRAVVDGRVHWLDGTRMGDRRLEDVGVPPFHWALPLRATGSALEPLEVAPLDTPASDTVIAFDASAGQHVPAAMTGSMILRGETATVLAGQLSLIPPVQKDQALRAMWKGLVSAAVIDEAASAYDDDTNILTLTATGSAPLDWRPGGLIPPGSTYWPISAAERPAGAFHDAPYGVMHPVFTRQQVTVRLPYDGEGYQVSGGRFDRTELGYRISRSVHLEGDTATIEILQRSLTDEITASEAERARAAAEARQSDYPRIVPPSIYRFTEADQTALAESEPTTADAWLDRALVLSDAGDYPAAVEAADHAVQLAPENSTAWANRGVYRFWTGDLEDAAADLEKAVDLDPSERIAMNGHALIANEEGRYQDVVIEMSRALRQAPTDGFALTMRARAYIAQQQYDRALRDIDALIAAQPTVLENKLLRVATLELADDRAGVETALDALVAERPEDPTVLLVVAAYHMAHDKPQEAFDIADRLIADTAEPGPRLLLTRGEAAIALGRLDVAARDFQTVREAAADDATLLNNLCWTAALGGVMLDQALRDCDAALGLEPGSAAILDSKGRVLLQRGDSAGALAVYDLALDAAPDLPASLYGRGLARLALGDPEAAEADKAAALAIDPQAARNFENYPLDEAPA